MRANPALVFCGLVCLFAVEGLGLSTALAQTGPRIISIAQQSTGTAPAASLSDKPVAGISHYPRVAADLSRRSFVFRGVTLVGVRALSPAQLAPIWAGRMGQRISVADTYQFANAIGTTYRRAGYALYSVSIPRQTFAKGVVVIAVMEGYVGAVRIDGNVRHADISLIKAYAARIGADRPLRQATLEREILLISSLPGVKVGSRFEPIAGRPGEARLVLTVLKKDFNYGLNFNNYGTNLLAQSEFVASFSANNLFREGDRTQIVVAAPPDVRRFQYYGFTHAEPLGTDGALATLSVGDLVTRPVGGILSGQAVIGDLQLSYPLILAVRQSLAVTSDFSMLDSNDALLGYTLSDERTRAVRLGVAYAVADLKSNVTRVSFAVSQGIDGLGARQGGHIRGTDLFEYGRSDFTKFNGRVSRDQNLPFSLILRTKFAGQYAPQHLPASEEFSYGGADFGQGLEQATIFGDRGVAGASELAHPIPLLQKYLSKTEGFVFADAGKTWNTGTIFLPAEDRAATAGFGVRTTAWEKLALQAEGTDVVVAPRSVDVHRGWRAVVAVNAAF